MLVLEQFVSSIGFRGVVMVRIKVVVRDVRILGLSSSFPVA